MGLTNVNKNLRLINKRMGGREGKIKRLFPTRWKFTKKNWEMGYKVKYIDMDGTKEKQEREESQDSVQ